MNAQKIKELAEKLQITENALKDEFVLEPTVKITKSQIRLEESSGKCEYESILANMCNKIVCENSAIIIEEAKLRMNNQLIERTEELKRATLEYATGFKVN